MVTVATDARADDPFTPPPAELAKLEREITHALAELRGARDIADHSPTAHNEDVVACAEWRLDRLLARHPRETEMPQPKAMA